MIMFDKNKWQARDITFILEDGKPVFYACLCIAWGEKGKREFRSKDMAIVDQVIGTIKRRNLEWWEVKQGKEKESYYLYYYPLIHYEWMVRRAKERQSPFQPSFSNSLRNLKTMFNYMVK